MNITIVIGCAAALVTLSPCRAGAYQVIGDEPSCRTCRINVGKLLTLGTEDGPGAIPAIPRRVTLDFAGRFWITLQEGLPIIFDQQGRFQRTVGRVGDGPGEYRNPQHAFFIPGDSMLVVDARGGRATVLDASLRATRSIVIPRSPIHQGLVQWPRLLLSSVNLESGDRGWPMHVYNLSGRNATLEKSFGLNEGRIRRGDEIGLQTYLVLRKGVVWSIDRYLYRFTEWSSSGTPLRTLERKPSWFVGPTNNLVGSANKPPSPRIAAVHVDSQGLIWIYTWTVASDWKKSWQTIQSPRGRTEISAGSTPQPEELFDTTIEVIDVDQRQVVARTQIPIAIIGVLSDGRAISYSSTADGVPMLGVWSVRLQR